jgi:hypothetical protein
MPVVIAHTGFWTYLLVAAGVLVVIGVLDPPLFQSITDVIRELARAVKGG